jgi:hypothetical protein
MKTTPEHCIASYEIVDHGIEHSQYFQGCGTSYTDFDECVTGCGDNALEAFDDALEQIACSHSVDLSAIERGPEYKTANTKKAQRFTVEAMFRRNGDLKRGQDMSEIDSEHYYYVSIRYCLGISDARILTIAGLA